MPIKIKLIYIIIIISHFNINLKSQKFDFNWIFGYDFSDNPSDTIEGINILEFDTPSGNPLVSFNPFIKSDFHNYGCSISDRNGKFLFCFDGYNVEDYRYNYITNSRQVCPDEDCDFLMQGSTIIPKPGNDTVYYLLYEQDEVIFLNSSASVMANFFNYSELVETYNHNGIVLKIIRKKVLNDTLDTGKVAYCKHANGRDWWALVPGRISNKYYTILIDPIGVKLINIQEVGDKRNYGDGFACFSPNGKFYVIGTKDVHDEWSGSEFDFYQFDRNTGKLSKHQNFKIDSTESISVGCAFSASNEILYICSGQVLYQYPIVNGQLNARIEIARYDGYLSHLFDNIYGPTYFGQLQLGPDDRIYCNSNFIQTRHLHVINRPNILGKSCDFRQHTIPFPSIKKTMPYYPNYRLGPIDDSISDTLGINNIPWCMWRYDQDTFNYLKFEFTDNSAYNVKKWSWNFGDNYTSDQQNPTHTYQGNGIYNVCLIVTNEFGADTLCRTIQIGTLSNSDYGEKINIVLLPNPFRDYLIVNIPEYNPEKMKMEIFDFNGKKVYSTKMLQGSNIIHTHEFVAGVYFLKFYELNRLVDLKVVVKI
ncbi:MAG: PKD domain-containing protein [Saprospiraceae bacterium]